MTMREHVTTALEVLAVLLLATAVGVALGRFALALGLGGASAVLFAASFVATREPKPKDAAK